MAKSMAVRVRNLQAQVIADELDDGTIRVYSGAVPANVDAALGGATVLAEMTFGNPSTGAPAAGQIVANPINSDPVTNASGVATFYRTFNAADEVVEQGTVGTINADMIVPTTTVTAGIEFRVTSYKHNVP